MPEVKKDIYHEIIDTLKPDNNIVFNELIRKGTPFKPWISWAYNSYDLYKSNKYKDCEMLVYLEVAPKTPIYEIAKLNELTDRLLPWLDPIEKTEPEVIIKKVKILGKETTLIGQKRTVRPGRLVFKEDYEINMTEKKSSQPITYPFSICCIIDVQPNIDFFKKPLTQEYNLDILFTNPWHLK
ncbi:MAG: hypothetical protein KAJ20_04245 [Candidatus Aenigmarchaeota archaeon]|nr:hypothetical protein [Candidatus Aenigmarchaeota archaeon]